VQPLLQWKSNKCNICWVRVCRLMCPTWNAFPILRCFSTSHQRRDFREKVIEYKMCVLMSSTYLCETFSIIWRTEPNVIKNVCRSSCKVKLFLLDLNETWIFSTDFGKISNIQFLENPFSRIQTDGQTDMTNLIVAFCNSANAPMNRKPDPSASCWCFTMFTPFVVNWYCRLPMVRSLARRPQI
jgi:hypothetical protein